MPRQIRNFRTRLIDQTGIALSFPLREVNEMNIWPFSSMLHLTKFFNSPHAGERKAIRSGDDQFCPIFRQFGIRDIGIGEMQTLARRNLRTPTGHFLVRVASLITAM
jgi:hypothetical protein